MTRFLHLFILLSPAAVCLVWLAESGRLRRAFIDTARTLRGLSRGRAAALAVLVFWATISGGDKQMSAPPPAAPEFAGVELQPEAAPETPLLSEPEGAGWPWGMALWPFDAVVSNAVAGFSATNVPPIPDAMLDSGLALYRAATNVALEARATNAVPAYAWDLCAADNRGLEFALPFAFPLGTNAYGRVGVLSNGRLSFGFHTLHRRTPDGLPFATPYPVATLAPLWGPYGLLPSAGSGVWAQGDSNRFTVCWQDMLLHGDTNLPATAQCDLLPGGAVRFRYGAIPGGAATNSTVGVQNLGPGWSFGGAAAPVFAGLELALRPVAAAGWADADPDGDGLTNFEEFMIGTDERLADTDGDGPSDSWEPAHGFDPLVAQFPDPDPDTDNDGVPDRWAGWMGDQLGDATNYYTLASLCADGDGDGFTGWYEMFALGSNPNQAASPGAAPEGFVDVVAVVTSSLPCVLRLTGEAGAEDIPWMPGLSPERVRLRLEVGKAYEAELSRVPSGTAFPTNGFWWAATAYESPGIQTSQTAVSGGTDTYDAGTVRVTGDDRGVDWWLVPGVAAIPALRLEVRLIVIDGPQTFCHSAEWAEIALASNSLHTGNVIWSSEPAGIEGEGAPLVFDLGDVAPGLYEVFAYSEENPLVWGSTHVVISHLDLAEATVYVDATDTNLTAIGISGDTYPRTGITVSSVPEGVESLSFRPSDLEPGTYTVTVGNGSCETREAEVVVISVILKNIEFVSDHNLLRKNPTSGSLWDDSTTECETPEWVAGLFNNPISHTMNTKISATVKIKVEPAGIGFHLIGDGPDDYVDFEKTGQISTGADQDVTVTADASLPNEVGILNRSINWKVDVGALACSALSSGPHRIYVTYGTPAGSVATERRLQEVCTTASGESTLTDCAEAVYRGMGAAFDLDGEMWGPVPIWLLHEPDEISQCPGLADFVDKHFQMLGLGAGVIRYCHAKADGTYEASTVPVTVDRVIGAEHPDPTEHDDYNVNESLVHWDGNTPPGPNSYEATCLFNGKHYALGAGVFATAADVVRASFASVSWEFVALDDPGPPPTAKWEACTDAPWVEAP